MSLLHVFIVNIFSDITHPLNLENLVKQTCSTEYNS
jgi:hypothetical protein